ncbi:DUF1634 domain-containing protein [Thermomicrobium sp. 4228-Ro]|uniref:DUF1634 domain-containing protein n=1 Tax=Thermomicrobium sp. 4228-Ro TaxID=2993937 RepID=UPI002248E74B|nr:DUF1634 domain-containing protein [Thermomicrobium sp. 4228-Ro]MCX2726562.1 DUF1634 domain-containing protein [Thermomicrobium sp. 4228-Ro]
MRDRSIQHGSPETNVLNPVQERIDLLVSLVLRFGVLVAATIGAIGLVLFFVRGPQPGDPQTLHELLTLQSGVLKTSPQAILTGLVHGQPDDIMRLGLLVLILTPTARVALTLVLFILERDVVFVSIALAVLIILVLGLAGIVGG